MASAVDEADSRKRNPSMEALPKIEHASGFERHILVRYRRVPAPPYQRFGNAPPRR